jgi:hypothetical protein
MKNDGRPEPGIDHRLYTSSEQTAAGFVSVLRAAKTIAEQELGTTDPAIIVQIASAISLSNKLDEIGNILDWELHHIANATEFAG